MTDTRHARTPWPLPAQLASARRRLEAVIEAGEPTSEIRRLQERVRKLERRCEHELTPRGSS